MISVKVFKSVKILLILEIPLFYKCLVISLFLDLNFDNVIYLWYNYIDFNFEESSHKLKRSLTFIVYVKLFVYFLYFVQYFCKVFHMFSYITDFLFIHTDNRNINTKRNFFQTFYKSLLLHRGIV